MSAHAMVLGILFIIFGFVFGSIMFNRYISYKKSLLSDKQRMDEAFVTKELKMQKRIIQDLTDRIEVLESIVTKEDFGLNQKFKEL